MIKFLMEPPGNPENPRRAGIVPLLIGATFVAFHLFSIRYRATAYPWVMLFGCLGFSYGLWLALFGVPRDAYGEPKGWWAYAGFAFWISSIVLGVWLGFFFW